MLTPIVYNYVYMITLKENTNISFFLVERQATFHRLTLLIFFVKHCAMSCLIYSIYLYFQKKAECLAPLAFCGYSTEDMKNVTGQRRQCMSINTGQP